MEGGAISASDLKVALTNSRFKGNAAMFGGAVSVDKLLQTSRQSSGDAAAQADVQLTIVAANFTKNQAHDQGGALFAHGSEVAIRNSSFEANEAGPEPGDSEWSSSGGAAFLSSCRGSSDIVQSSFTANTAVGTGGALLIMACPLAVTNTLFQQNQAGASGGAIRAVHRRSSNTPISALPELSLTGCQLAGNLATGGDGGGVMGTGVRVRMAHMNVTGNRAPSGRGGACCVLNNAYLNISSSVFSLNSALDGGAVGASLTGLVEVRAAGFIGNSATRRGGAMSIAECDCVTVARNSRFDSNSAMHGGALHAQPGPWPAASSSSMSVLLQGETCLGSVVSAADYGPAAAAPAAAAVVEANVTVVVAGVSAVGNVAKLHGGVVYIDGGNTSALLLQGLEAANNSAVFGHGGVAGVVHDPNVHLEMQAQASFRVVLVDCTLWGNTAPSGIGGALAMLGDATNSPGNISLLQQAMLFNTTVRGNRALSGGALGLSGRTSLLVRQSRLEANNASQDGGAIMGAECVELQLSDATVLSGNSALRGRGGGLYSNGCDAVLVGDSTLSSNTAESAGAMFVSGSGVAAGGGATSSGDTVAAASAAAAAVLVVIGTQISNNSAHGSSQGTTVGGNGGGMWVTGPVAALVANCTLTGNTAAAHGGALIVDTNSTCSTQQVTAVVDSASVRGLTAESESQLAMSTSNQAALSTLLRDVVANGSVLDAAVVADCFLPQTEAGDPALQAAVFATIGDATGNRVQTGYGPYISTDPSQLRASSSLAYAPVLVQDANSSATPLTSLKTAAGYTLTTLSMEPMDLGLRLLDAFGQVTTDGTGGSGPRMATLRASVAAGGNSSCEAAIISGNEAQAYTGEASLMGMRVRAPKGTYRMTIAVVDTAFATLAASVAVDIVIPPCRVGEVPRDRGYSCQPCDPLTFSLWEDTAPLNSSCLRDDALILMSSNSSNSSTTDAPAAPAAAACYSCPQNADCPGGALLLPTPGAWHSAANSTFVSSCPNPEACRGGDEDMQAMLKMCQAWWYLQPLGFDYWSYVRSILDNNSTRYPDAPGALRNGTYDPTHACALWGLPYGHPAAYMTRQCASGYAGNLCGVCESVEGRAYANDGAFNCAECLEPAGSVVLSIVLYLINVIVILGTILITFLADYTEDQELAAGDIVRIIVMHCQYFLIITRYNIDWPNPIKGLAFVFGVITGAIKQVVTPSCFLGPDTSSERQAHAEVLTGLLSPFISIATIMALWVLRYYYWHARDTTPGTPGINRAPVFDGRKLSQLAQERRMRRGGSGAADSATADVSHSGKSSAAQGGSATPEAAEGANDNGLDSFGEEAVTMLTGAQLLQRLGALQTRREVSDSGEGLSPPNVSASGSVVASSGQQHPNASVGGAPPQTMGGSIPQRQPFPRTQSLPGALQKSRSLPQYGVGEGRPGSALQLAQQLDAGAQASPRAPAAAAAAALATQRPAAQTLTGTTDSPGARLRPAIRHSTSTSLLMSRALQVSVGKPPLSRDTSLSPAQAMSPEASPFARSQMQQPGWQPNSRAVRLSLFGPEDGGSPVQTSRRQMRVSFSSTPATPLGPPAPTASTRSGNPLAKSSSARSSRSGSLHVSLSGRAQSTDVLTCASPGSGSSGSWLASSSAITAVTMTPGGGGGLSIGRIELDVIKEAPSVLTPRASRAPEGGTDPFEGHAEGAVSGSSARQPQSPASGAVTPGRGRQSASGAATPGGTTDPGGGHTSGAETPSGGASPPLTTPRKKSGMQLVSTALQRLKSMFSIADLEPEEGEQLRWAALINIDRTMSLWEQLLFITMIAAFIMYPAWSTAVLQIFGCFMVDNRSGPWPQYQLAAAEHGYWIQDMNQACYTGVHLLFWVPIGAVFIALVCFGIPLLSFVAIWKHRKSLDTVHVAQTFGFLYRRYHDVRYYWQSVSQFQTLLLVVVEVFGRVLPVYQRAMLLQIMLVVTLTLNTYFEPNKFEVLSKMEFLSLAILSVTLSSGLFFVPPSDQTDPIGQVGRITIAAIILVLNIGVCTYFVYMVINTMAISTLKKAYVYLRKRALGLAGKLCGGVVSAEPPSQPPSRQGSAASTASKGSASSQRATPATPVSAAGKGTIPSSSNVSHSDPGHASLGRTSRTSAAVSHASSLVNTGSLVMRDSEVSSPSGAVPHMTFILSAATSVEPSESAGLGAAAAAAEAAAAAVITPGPLGAELPISYSSQSQGDAHTGKQLAQQ
ncbi:hypothetical protein HXX76_000010 [Chlamydomonas incerta]|uniref:TRP C-terminal domain-containing protein n=1 Tax=Chlamydomonas incerta TaxID=51695 RepID=A0A836B2E8_CHLIN|nr:hypothetical protein HXX76_000010 [Chlamydomonas incerta]|eukprot:KAG2445388.1 hypothetical protein HXX76_000010 [Chlamydomonas incerta]